jgi:hypothetical protein
MTEREALKQIATHRAESTEAVAEAYYWMRDLARAALAGSTPCATCGGSGIAGRRSFTSLPYTVDTPCPACSKPTQENDDA